MKIALIILHADPARGGAERYTVDLAAALAAAGHDVSLVATSFAAETPGKRVHLDVKAASRRGYYLKMLDALDRHLEGEKYDAVHAMLPVRRCDVYHPHAGLAVEGVASGHEKYDGVRRAMAVMGNRLNLKRRAFAVVEKELLNGANPPVVLCLSEYVKAAVRKHYALPEQKLATLFNAVDLKKFDPSSRPGERIRMRKELGLKDTQLAALIMAQDFQRKGLAEAIKALPKDKRLSLMVVGKQDPMPYVELARQCGVDSQLITCGPTRDPYAYYAAADFFVLPTRHDPCSLVVLEALAMGLPVISTKANGATEIMTEGLHGFVLADARDVGTLREKYQVLMDDAKRAEIAAACLELRPRLSQDEHVRKLISIYDEVRR